MSSGGNNACSHLDLSALADKKPLAVARSLEKSGGKSGVAGDKRLVSYSGRVRDDERRKRRDKFWWWQMEGKIDEGRLQVWLLTRVSEAASSVGLQQMLHFFTFEKPDRLFSAAKRGSVSHTCTEPSIRECWRLKSLWVTSFSFSGSVTQR